MIYLASPYWHPDVKIRDERYRKACEAHVKHMLAGKVTFCPIAAHAGLVAMLLPEAQRNAHDFWMKQDLPILERCSELHILCLEGWLSSKGIKAEVRHAQQFRIPIIYLGSDYV